ncbi:MAG: hypothetical protein V4736_02715, partial [Bdellovibrionota bacterium]
LTNSSSIFQGVEVPLYPLLKALQKNPSPKHDKIWQECKSRLKDDVTIEQIVGITDSFLKSNEARSVCDFPNWPSHSKREQLDKLLTTSDQLRQLHKDEKSLITEFLSEFIFDRCGQIMLDEGFKPGAPYCWINHDVLTNPV